MSTPTQGSLLGGITTYTGERDKLDYYPTPPEILHPLMDAWWRFLKGPTLRIIEPCAGRALSLARELEHHGHEVITGDIDQGAPVDIHGDCRSIDWSAYDAEWCVTNPPYLVDGVHAADIIRAILPHVTYAAFLLRLSFLEPCRNRVDLVAGGRLRSVVVMPRVSFRGGGTDTVTTAWMVFQGDRLRSADWTAPGKGFEPYPRFSGYVATDQDLERARIEIAGRSL